MAVGAPRKSLFREFRAPDSMIRPLKTFQVRIGGLDVPIAPAAFADLHDTDLVKVWKEGEAVYCMFQGRVTRPLSPSCPARRDGPRR